MMNDAERDATANALERMALDGADMSKPMKMDFFVAVPSEQAGQEIASRVTTMGFDASVEKDEESGDWTCYCTKTLVPELDEVVRTEEQLGTLAKPFGGYSDGFGSYGN